MNAEQEEYFRNLYLNSDKEFYHNISVDVVILGYHERTLKVLLQKPHFTDKWMLPGGFIRRGMSVEDASAQVVQERTQLSGMPLYHYGVYSRPGRSGGQQGKIADDLRQVGFNPPDGFWMFDDFVSVTSFALTEFSLVKPSGVYFSEECEWWDVAALPELLYDHAEMVEGAMRSLRYMVYFHPIGSELLPEKFTLPEIRSLYETILGRKLDERNFAKKLLNLGVIVKLDEQRNIGAHRSPYLYKFDMERYNELLKKNDVIIL